MKEAKRENNIPLVQQPISVTKVPDKVDPRKQLRQYEYINNKGQKITIREDVPREYPGDANGKCNQGHYFNAGPSGRKLKQHFNFDKFNSKKQ